jgi:radical SAM enzyme (TIGR01210 family)
MGVAAPAADRPHYFLLRTFLGENDLLVILNTKRCRYSCDFCTLPNKSSRTWISEEDVARQFLHVARACRHALSIVDRVTLSNEGSVLDEGTLGPTALEAILGSIGRMRRVRRIELETRLEFVTPARVRALAGLAPRARVGILTGFETASPRIRDDVLGKRQSLADFLRGLDRVAEANAWLTAHVLFKPDPSMSDDDAYWEAQRSVHFLIDESAARGIPLQIRLNPMYRARGSPWSTRVGATADYSPPRLTDVMALAEEMTAAGATIYIGLSTEGLATAWGTYVSRADYSPDLIKDIKSFNDRQIARFPSVVHTTKMGPTGWGGR